MPRIIDAVTAAALALLGVAVVLVAGAMPPATSLAADASLLPRMIGVGLVLTGLGLALVALVRRRGAGDESVGFEGGEGIPLGLPVDRSDELRAEQESVAAQRPAGLATAVVLAVVTVYAATAFAIGYVTTSVVFMVVLSLVLGYGRTGPQRWWLAAFVVLVSGGTYVGLFVLLGVRAPGGLLP